MIARWLWVPCMIVGVVLACLDPSGSDLMMDWLHVIEGVLFGALFLAIILVAWKH